MNLLKNWFSFSAIIFFSILLQTSCNNRNDIYNVINQNPLLNIDVVQSGGRTDVIEGGQTDSYTIKLSFQPLDDVNITITPNSQVIVNDSTSPINVTFTQANWSNFRP